MTSESERDYATQTDYAEWVRESTLGRLGFVEASLREAFSDVIHNEEIEVVVFSDLKAQELANKLTSYPLILKPLLLAANIAARAIERDLGIKNLNTYDARLSQERAFIIAGYIKPFLKNPSSSIMTKYLSLTLLPETL